jgi:hypothetical protein
MFVESVRFMNLVLKATRVTSPKRRLLFTPGIISLALLLPVSLIWLSDIGIFRPTYVIDANWYDSTDYRYVNTKRPHATIILDGSATDSEKLREVKRMTTEWITKGDSSRALKVHLTDEAKYQSVVDLFALANAEASLLCMADKSDVWIFISKYRPTPRGLMCGTMYMLRQGPRMESSSDLWESLKLWPVTVMLIVLAAANMFSIIGLSLKRSSLIQ